VNEVIGMSLGVQLWVEKAKLEHDAFCT